MGRGGGEGGVGGWKGGTGVSPVRRQADRFLILKATGALDIFFGGKFVWHGMGGAGGR